MPTITITEYIDVDLVEALDDLSERELLELRAEIDKKLGADVPDNNSIENLYYACRDGDRDRVFDVARRLSMDVLGRVC